MTRLTPEREKEIRDSLCESGRCDYCCPSTRELLSEIDALRAEKEHQHKLKDEVEFDLEAIEKDRDQLKALLEELNSRVFPGSIDTADSLVLLKRERDQLKAEVAKANLVAETAITEAERLKAENERLKADLPFHSRLHASNLKLREQIAYALEQARCSEINLANLGRGSYIGEHPFYCIVKMQIESTIQALSADDAAGEK